MHNVHFKIKMNLLNGVLRQVMEVELGNLELTSGMAKACLGIVGLEEHSWLSLTSSIFTELDGVIRYPFSLPVEEVTILISADIVGGFDLLHGVSQIDGRLLVLITLPILGVCFLGELTPIGSL